jgi:hypothetical protein
MMSIDPRATPNLVMSLPLEPDAPRAARHHVAQVEILSPDLRDAVMLLTSELVTRAVRQGRPGSGEAVELLVWMPADLVRVELRAPSEYLVQPPEPAGPHYDHILLDQVAHRWSIDTGADPARIWFEIDRDRLWSES